MRVERVVLGVAMAWALGCSSGGSDVVPAPTDSTVTDTTGVDVVPVDTLQPDTTEVPDAGGDVATQDTPISDPGPGEDTPVEPDVAPPAPTCEAYCTAVEAACTGAYEQYPAGVSCLAYCADWAKLPAGQADDVSGNTIGCRMAQAALVAAGGDPAVSCAAAGPTGYGTCGTFCENYCHLSATNCTGAQALYSSESKCKAACAQLSTVGEPGVIQGDSLWCRMAHLALAGSDPANGSAAAHCPNGGEAGGTECVCKPECTDKECGDDGCGGECGVCEAGKTCDGGTCGCKPKCSGKECGDDGCGGSCGTCGTADECTFGTCLPAAPPPTCEEYCAAVQSACGSADEATSQFADTATCIDYCANLAMLAPGKAGESTGNTIACRLYHAQTAATLDKATQCVFAGPTGGDVCGSWCENYCSLALNNCSGAKKLYTSEAVCLGACKAFPTTGLPGDDAGDSVQCRLYHVTQAGASAAMAAIHCPYGGPTGGGVCIDPTLIPTCETYCDTVQASCGDAGAPNSQYKDKAACIEYCGTLAKLPPGQTDIPDGNTIACRLYHAGVAATLDKAAQCVYAGPTGGDVCGSWCDNYCQLALANCTGPNELFATKASCLSACAVLDTTGKPGDATGDTVQCRIGHLALAGDTDETAAQCQQGGPDGGGVCISPALIPTCEAYCTTVQASCGDGGAVTSQYADKAACIDYCQNLAQLVPGQTDVPDGNTIACRLYHAETAATLDKATQCVYAGPSGGDVCGSWCENYCDLASLNCTGANELYASDAACGTACDALATTGKPGDLGGNTVQCRLTHLGLAGKAADAALQCTYGGPTGGALCSD